MTAAPSPDLGDLFKDLIWSNLVEALLAWVFVQAPYLAVWPIRPIVTKLVMMLTDKLYEGARLAIEIEKIVLVNHAHRQAFDVASVRLRIAAQNIGVDSDAFRKARAEHKAALSRFVRFGA